MLNAEGLGGLGFQFSGFVIEEFRLLGFRSLGP